MNFDAIISEYYSKSDIIAFFKKIAGDWWEELRQDVFVILCEYDRDKIIDMHQRKCLKFFIVRISLNQFRSKTSKFYYNNFKNNKDVLSLAEDINALDSDFVLLDMWNSNQKDRADLLQREAKLERIEKATDKLRYFENEIFRLWIELGSYKAINNKTGIPTRTVSFAVKNAIDNIKNNLK